MTSSLRRRRAPALLAVPAALLALAPVAPAAAASAVPESVGATYPARCDALDLSDEAEVDARALPADDVFAGTVRAVQPTAGDARRVGYLVAVERVFRGTLSKRSGPGKQVLVTIAWPTDARPTVAKGKTYLFFTNDSGGRVVADPCTGTALLPRGLTPRLAATLRRFLASVEPTATPSPTPQPVSFREPDDPAGDPPDLSRVLASGGAITLIGVLGLVLVSRLGRRRG